MHIVGTNDIPFYPMLLTNLRICLRNSFILTGSTFIIARSSAIDVIITIFILEIPYSFISSFKFLSSFYPICFFLICFIFATWLRIYVLSTHFLGFQENSVQRSCGSYSWAIFQANHETLSRDQSGIGKCGHTRRSLKPINWYQNYQMETIYNNQIMSVLLFNSQYFCFRVLMSVEWSYRYSKAVIGSF